MKNLFSRDFLRQDLSNIGLIVFGILLMLNPDFGSAAISGLLGWSLVSAGAAGLLISILSKPRLSTGAIVISAAILILGIYLLKNPLQLAKITGVVIGLILIKQGLDRWMEAKLVQRAGGPYLGSLIIACAMLVIGLRQILSPLSASRFLLILAGALLIAIGIGNILHRRKIKGFLEDRDYDPNIIDADN